MNKDKLKAAVYDVIYRDRSLRGVAKTYNMSVMILKRYVRKMREAIDTGSVSPRYEPDYKQAQVFTES